MGKKRKDRVYGHGNKDQVPGKYLIPHPCPAPSRTTELEFDEWRHAFASLVVLPYLIEKYGVSNADGYVPLPHAYPKGDRKGLPPRRWR
jgi:hypothetical protein